MTHLCMSAEVVAHSRRSLLRRARSFLKTWVARAVWCWARIELKIQAVSVHELQAGELAQVQNAFRAGGSQARPADLLGQAAGQVGIVVAWLGTRPVGIGFVHWAGPRNAELQQRLPGVPEIYRLWVRPVYRTLGLGTDVVRHIEGLALGRGLSRIGLGVHEGNLRARALYLRLGYQPDPQPYVDSYLEQGLDGAIRPVNMPAVFMVKTLVTADGQ